MMRKNDVCDELVTIRRSERICADVVAGDIRRTTIYADETRDVWLIERRLISSNL